MIFVKKIRSIFRLQLFIVGYLPLLLLASVIFFQMSKTHKNYTDQEILKSAHHGSLLIENFFTRISLNLKVLSKQENIRSLQMDKQILRSQILQIKKMYSYFEDILIINIDGSVLVSTEEDENNPVVLNENLSSDQKLAFPSALYLDDDFKRIIIINVPVFDKDQNLLRFIAAKINMNSILHIVHFFHFGETGKISILNEQGQYIGGVLEDSMFKEFEPANIKDKILSSSPSGFTFHYQNESGKKLIAAMVPLNKLNKIMKLPRWKVILTQEFKESYYLLFLLRKYLFLLIPFIFLLVFIFNNFTTNLVLRPLQILLKGTQKVTQGDLQFKTNINSDNEIGELSKHFDYMIESVSSYRKDLQNEILQKELAKNTIEDLNKNLERKVEERTLEINELKEFYQNILNSIVSGVMVLDKNGMIKFLNPKGEKLLNHNLDEVRNKGISSAGFNEIFSQTIINSLSSTKEISQDLCLSDNIVFGVKVSPNLIIGSFKGAIVIFNDISERKKMEKELIESEKMFSFGLLSTGMAHDFNNVLNRIKISNDISKKMIQTHNLKEYFFEIDDAISEGQSMTKSLLSFAKKENVELVEIDLYSALKLFEDKLKNKLELLKVELNLDCIKDIKILSDANYLQQIFQNIFQNSLQAFSEEDEKKIQIEVSKKEKHCQIIFKDNGPGIDKDVVKHIFEPFYSTKKCSQNVGWGLGLALVKSLVEMMHGVIFVRSEKNKGTEFILAFPII